MALLFFGNDAAAVSGNEASALDICSSALVRLGATSISSFEGIGNPSTCANIYPFVKNSILSLYDWKFSLAKQQLSRDTVTPVSQYKYQFTLPADRVSDGPYVLYQSDNQGSPAYKDFREQGGKLLANVDTLFMDYNTQAAETVWPAYFRELMVHAMMVELAFVITDDLSKSAHFQNITFGRANEGGRGGLFGAAMFRNAQNAQARSINDHTLNIARHGGVGEWVF